MRRALPWAAAAGLAAIALLPSCRPSEEATDPLRDARELHLAGREADALRLYDEALRRARDSGDQELRIRALLGSAEVLFELPGELEEAEDRLEAALAAARSLREAHLEADALASLGIYYWYYRRQRDRCLEEFYRPALALYRRTGDRGGVAAMEGRIGLVHLARADYQGAGRHLEESRSLFEDLGDGPGLSDAHRYLGALFVQLERYDRAREHYRKSRELSEAHGYELGRRRTEALVAHLHLRRGEYEETLGILDGLIGAEAAPTVSKRSHLVTSGHALLHLGRPADAQERYRRALAIDRATPGTDPPFRARTLTMLAHARMQAGDLDGAAESLSRAEALPIADQGWEPRVLQALARADLADRRGRPRESLAHLQAAAEIEGRTIGSARSALFQTQYRQIFERLLSLELDGADAQAGARELIFRFLEQLRYRSFRSALIRLGDSAPGPPASSPRREGALEAVDAATRRHAEAPGPESWQALQRAYSEYEETLLLAELTAPRRQHLAAAHPVELPELQRTLKADDALIEYVVSGQRVFALVVTRRELSTTLLPVSAEELEAKVKLFRFLLFEEPGEAWRSLAAELGRRLFDPLRKAGALVGARRLVLVPMGPLHDLPFCALAGSDGRLLLEDYTVLRSPSASLWARPRRPAGEAREGALEVVAFAHPKPRRSGLEPLVFARREAVSVAEAFGGLAYLGSGASEEVFLALAPEARRIHLAAHGVAEPRLPLHSRLYLAAGGSEDGELTVREILDLDLSAELISLSACSSAANPPATGSFQLEVDRLGFVEAFLHVGAGSVVATLVPVSDAGSAAFMTTFYRYLRSMPPAAALAAARRRMLQAPVPSAPGTAPRDLRHPRYWAPFVLVARGEGGSLLSSGSGASPGTEKVEDPSY